MNVFAILAALSAAAALLPALRYNLHMFQLMGYKNREHLRWLRKNRRKQALLGAAAALGLLALVLPRGAVFLAAAAVNLAICRYYLYLRKTNVKKKLVYTARVKRQIFTAFLLLAAAVALVWRFAGGRFVPGTLELLLAAQFFLPLLANLVNRPAEQAIERWYINDAKRRLNGVPGLVTIGITGSYGKTSVKFFLNTLLREKFRVLMTPESYNTPMGIVKTIRSALKPTHEIFLCEMGARHVGDIKEICDIVHPRHGVITSIGPQHLETFFHMQNIVNTKFELADALPPGGLLFLNGDNEYITGNAGSYGAPIFYRTGDSGAGYRASEIELSQLGTAFTLTAPDGETERFQTKLVGAHNVVNIAGAIAVAHTLGMKLGELKVPVRRLQPVAHRLQLIERGGVTVIDDAYNSNPAGSRAAAETLAMFGGVRILVTPGMVELGEKEAEFNYQFGACAAKCCDYILLVGRKRTEPIRRGALDAGFPAEKCGAYDTLEDALAFAYGVRDAGHKYILLENDLPDQY